jgi:glycosyltransferase involved in cell wall biosynthesis
MKEPPFISVVVPSYRQFAHVEHLLESLKKQDYTNFEVIVVDSSNDETTELLRKSLENSKFLSTLVCFSERKSAGYQRSVGIEKARHPWIFTTDTDCVLPANHLSRLALEIENKGAQETLVLGGSIENGTPSSAWGSASYWTEFSDFAPSRAARTQLFVPSANLLFSRRFALQNGAFADMPVSDDLYTLTLWLQRGAQVHFVPQLPVVHRNRVQGRVVLAHQFALGKDAASVRRLVGGTGSWLLGAKILWPALPFWRLLRVSVRVLPRNSWRERVSYFLFLPATFVTLLAWSAGFVVGARTKPKSI